MRFDLYTILYLAASANSFGVALWLIYRYRWRRGTINDFIGAFVLASCSLWMLAHVLERVSQQPSAKVIWDKIEYLGIACICMSWVIYSIHYVGYSGSFKNKNLLIPIYSGVALLSLSAVALVATNDLHEFIWRVISIQSGPGEIQKSRNLGFYIIIFYFMGTCIAFAVLMILRSGRAQRIYKAQVRLTPVFALVPIVLVIIELVLRTRIIQPYNLTPLAYSLSTWIIVFVSPALIKKSLLAVSRETILEKFPDAVLVLSPKGKIMDLNTQALHTFGIKYKQEALDRSIDFFWDEATECLGFDSNGAKPLPRKGRYYEPAFSEIFDGRGHVASRVVVLRDVTERLQDEQSAFEIARDLKSRNEELRQFTSAAGSDLKEPLRMVANYLGLLLRRYSSTFDKNANEYIDFAVDGAQRMEILLDALLSYSKIGAQDLGLEDVDLGEVLDEVRRNLEIALLESRTHLEATILPRVRADKTQLVQLFQNLIANAIKFRSENVLPEIIIGGETREHEIIISVKDNGIGINPDQQERIFQIFQRLHTREEYEGSGIGLAICKRIVERHGGRIWLESAPGSGSTFYFTLAR